MVFLNARAGADKINIVYYDLSKKHEQVDFTEVGVKPDQKIVQLNGQAVSKEMGFVKGHKYDVRATRLIGGKEKVYAKSDDHAEVSRLLRRGRARPRPALPSCAAAPVARARAARPRYRNPDLPATERAADLVGAHDASPRRSAQTMTAAPAIPRLGVPAYEWWNEALHGVARAGPRDRVPAGDRAGGDVRRGAGAAGGERHLRRGARQVQPGRRRAASTGATRG